MTASKAGRRSQIAVEVGEPGARNVSAGIGGGAVFGIGEGVAAVEADPAWIAGMQRQRLSIDKRA